MNPINYSGGEAIPAPAHTDDLACPFRAVDGRIQSRRDRRRANDQFATLVIEGLVLRSLSRYLRKMESENTSKRRKFGQRRFEIKLI